MRIRKSLPGGMTQSQIEEDFEDHEKRPVGLDRDVMKVGWL